MTKEMDRTADSQPDVHGPVKEQLASLRAEYSQLFTLIEKYHTIPYSVIPVAVTILGAGTLFGSNGNEGLSKGGLWGVVVSYGMVLLVFWQSYVHCFLCAIGARLVELECQINSITGAESNSGLGYFSKLIGDGYRVMPGLFTTTTVVIIFSIVVYAASAFFACRGLYTYYGLPWLWCSLALGFPLAAMLALLINMVVVESKAKIRKEAILKRFNGSIGSRPLGAALGSKEEPEKRDL